MTNEFDYLIREGAAVSQEANNENVFFDKDKQKEEQVNLDNTAQEAAIRFIGLMDMGISHFLPYVKIESGLYDAGVHKFTPVFRKYGGGELPLWAQSLLMYNDEFMAGAWFAGFALEVKKQMKIEAERVAKEADQDKQQQEKSGDNNAEK